jgi:hypothetical protein
VAKAYEDIDPTQVAVSGYSYGGGESWVQASQRSWDFAAEQTADLPPEGRLPVLELQVAVPKYSWTDLGYSLTPNGHAGGPDDDDLHESSLGEPDSDTGEGYPFGTLKASYLNAFFAIGETQPFGFEKGNRATQTDEGPINIDAWRARAEADPYDVGGEEDSIVRQIRRGLTDFRGAYYQDEKFAEQENGRKVAIFAIQGWTDDLFTAVEAFRQYVYLKRLDERWPIELAIADIGHPRGQNRTTQWRRLNNQAFQFLQSHLGGSHEQRTTVSSQPTLCEDGDDSDSGGDAAKEVRGRSPDHLSQGQLEVRYTRGDTQTFLSGEGDPDGLATDAVVGSQVAAESQPGKCQESRAEQFPGRYTATSEPLDRAVTYVGLGEVEVRYRLLTGNTATLNARVWDAPPEDSDEPTRLMSRGTYRIDTPAYDEQTGRLRLPLYGNHWPLAPGHSIRLDLAQVDTPTYRQSDAGGSISFDAPRLELPLRQASDITLEESEESAAIPLLPLAGLPALPPDLLEDLLAALPDEILGRLPEELLENLPAEVLEDLPDDVLDDLPDDVLEELPEDVREDLPADVLDRLDGDGGGEGDSEEDGGGDDPTDKLPDLPGVPDVP